MYRDRPVKFVHNKFLKTFFYKKKIYESAAHMRQGLLVKIEILYLHLVIVRSLLLLYFLFCTKMHPMGSVFNRRISLNLVYYTYSFIIVYH